MKKTFVFVVVVLLMYMIPTLFITSSVQASRFSSMYGFTFATDIYENVGWETNHTSFSRYDGRSIGSTTTTAGYFRIKPEYNENPSKDYYVVMGRYTMTPLKTSVYKCGLFNWFNCQDFGFSDKLVVSSQLDYYASGVDNYLVYYSPTTMYNEQKYTVGGGLSFSQKDGFGIGVYAEAEFLVKDMEITNISRSSLRYYGTEFNYNMRNFVVKDSFYTETYNYSMYIVENPASRSFFSNRLLVEGTFGRSAGWGRYDTYYGVGHPRYTNRTAVYFVHHK